MGMFSGKDDLGDAVKVFLGIWALGAFCAGVGVTCVIFLLV